MTIAEFAQAVYGYSVQTNASCTSWGRTLKHTIAVGGFNGDPHMYWLGADLVYDVDSLQPETRQTIAKSYGLYLLVEATHDHVQPLDWVNKPVPV